MTFARDYWLLLAVAVIGVPVARADTFGLPPIMEFEREWKTDETALTGPLAIRTAEVWGAMWKKHAPNDRYAPTVDFDRWMVVGIASPAPTEPRQVYRIESDDAANPKELVVRIADHGFSQVPKWVKIKGVRLHMVVTGQSALPVRFVRDAMEDAGGGWVTEYVDSEPLGNIDGVKCRAGAGRGFYREDVEKLIHATLSEKEIAKLKTQIRLGGASKRYPGLWSVVRMHRNEKNWDVEYDGLRFTVDVQTGEVKRGEWKWQPRSTSPF